jgi:hypothetical protein
MSAKVGPRTLATVLLLALAVAMLRGVPKAAQQAGIRTRPRRHRHPRRWPKRPSSAYPARAVTVATLAPAIRSLERR